MLLMHAIMAISCVLYELVIVYMLASPLQLGLLLEILILRLFSSMLQELWKCVVVWCVIHVASTYSKQWKIFTTRTRSIKCNAIETISCVKRKVDWTLC